LLLNVLFINGHLLDCINIIVYYFEFSNLEMINNSETVSTNQQNISTYLNEKKSDPQGSRKLLPPTIIRNYW